MQSAIVQKATGQTVLDYLRPRLFEPLGIEQPTWETSPQGVSLGGYGLSIRTEDIAKFGQLYLQKGQWHGKQLIPTAWVEAATSLQTSNGSNPQSDWDQGYGYQFWRARHGAYRGDGAFGQYCIVLPKQDAVIAITSGVRDMQAVLNLVWEKLLPALSTEPLAADEQANQKLQTRLAGLALPTPQATTAGRVNVNLLNKTYTFSTNDQKLESLSLAFEDDPTALTLVCKLAGGAEQRLPIGEKAWKKGRLALGRMAEQPASASGAWTGENTFTAKICFYETPFTVTLRMEFSEQEVKLDSSLNVGFGGTRGRQLIGQKKS
jgi:hypothetical protein